MYDPNKVINYTKYLSMPYKINGISWNGCDCWGLVKLIVNNEFDIKLPTQFSMQNYKATDDDMNLKSDVVKQCANWYEIVDSPRRNTIGLCTMTGLHAVYFIEPNLTIEMLDDIGCYVCRNNIHHKYIRYYSLKGDTQCIN